MTSWAGVNLEWPLRWICYLCLFGCTVHPNTPLWDPWGWTLGATFTRFPYLLASYWVLPIGGPAGDWKTRRTEGHFHIFGFLAVPAVAVAVTSLAAGWRRRGLLLRHLGSNRSDCEPTESRDCRINVPGTGQNSAHCALTGVSFCFVSGTKGTTTFPILTICKVYGSVLLNIFALLLNRPSELSHLANLKCCNH